VVDDELNGTSASKEISRGLLVAQGQVHKLTPRGVVNDGNLEHIIS
jgi:hypothetical protein